MINDLKDLKDPTRVWRGEPRIEKGGGFGCQGPAERQRTHDDDDKYRLYSDNINLNVYTKRVNITHANYFTLMTQQNESVYKLLFYSFAEERKSE